MATSTFIDLYRATASSGRLEDPASTFLIVIVHSCDDSFIGAALEQERYRVRKVSTWAQACAIAATERADLVIGRWDEDAGEAMKCCRIIKGQCRTELVPILILTPATHVADQIAALEAGADDILCEPLDICLFRARVKALLRHKSALDRLDQSEGILFALAHTVEKRDQQTGEHCERLALLSLAMGVSMNLPVRDLLALERGGYVHDVGKLAMPDSILFKKGPLTAEEWTTMRTHTLIGEEICRSLKSLELALPIVRSHHERWNGSGYPDGLKREAIPLLARVLQIADIYDALVSPRPYKAALPGGQALEIMWQETGQGWRDPQLMKLFQNLHDRGIVDMVYASTTPDPKPESGAVSLLNMHRALLNEALLAGSVKAHSNLLSTIPLPTPAGSADLAT